MHIHNPAQEISIFEQLRELAKNLIADNADFVDSHTAEYFAPFAETQYPRATVVMCSDARVHTKALNKTPDGDLFMVRNIGNQIATAEGSVEYGVRHLHTPLLLIVGHVACGAIKAVASDYSGESAAIQRELGTIQLPPPKPENDANEEWLHGVIANVNNQVSYALIKFADEVKTKKLAVVGTIYDFQNIMGQGQGRLVFININGNIDTAHISAKLLELR